MVTRRLIKVEVAYALPHRQKIVTIEVPEGTTVFEAAQISGIAGSFDGLDLTTSTPMGIFGVLTRRPNEQLVIEGQRVEIYRPLTVDPKVARANRAAKLAEKSKHSLGKIRSQ